MGMIRPIFKCMYIFWRDEESRSHPPLLDYLLSDSDTLYCRYPAMCGAGGQSTEYRPWGLENREEILSRYSGTDCE